MRFVPLVCPAAPTAVALPHGEIHVWAVDLDPPAAAPIELLAELTADERTRGDRYKSTRVRDQFVVCRGFVRRVLGGYLGVPPIDVPITYEGSGKPTLDGPADVRFNLSHTDGLALLAVVRGRRVGVDVERTRPVPNRDSLVDRFFSPAEQVDYRELAEADRERAFFRGWVCKEAVIKAAGASVEALDAFDLELRPDRPPAVRAARHPLIAAGRWDVTTWEPRPGYAAAVAVEENGDSPQRHEGHKENRENGS